jgi:hypothetical protein
LRHYGFGNARGTVTIDGRNAGISSWSDQTIVVRVPGGVTDCSIQQQAQYGGSEAQCGQLTITTANTATGGAPSNAKQSIDTVTVTIGGKPPVHVAASVTAAGTTGVSSIQTAIDAAQPGDLIIVDPTCTTTAAGVVSQAACTPITTTSTQTHVPSNHSELLLMWKPVRLQGVGAASSIINANTHPSGKLDPWRRQVVCLFGLAINGYPNTNGAPSNVPPVAPNPFDPTGTYTCGDTNGVAWTAFNGGTDAQQVDRLPLEPTLGWDATQNANLAEQLQEPSLMGALEGAGVTVLAKGVQFPAGSEPFGVGSTAAATFPTGTRLLTPNDCGYGNPNGGGGGSNNGPFLANPYPSNFFCNPSSIDGLGITDSSQGGGGIFVHGWAHYLQIANNRIYNNSGTLAGGINIGQGEFAPAYLAGTTGTALTAPGSCQNNPDVNTQLPYCEDMFVNIHNNAVMLNNSTGDELFSAVPAGAGGVSICTGSDYYKFNYNWVCGNLSTGDGGGFGQHGFVYNGDIEHNSFIFNQSTNPTISTNGGGLVIMGTPDSDPTCGVTTDADCVPLNANPPSDGIGPGLIINANLIMGNAAESGSGGGLRFQDINGSDVITFPAQPLKWFQVTVTNNIIANNVAGWDGGGISLQDAIGVNLINNTIVSNDTTASAGVLFNTLQAPLGTGSNGPGPCATVYPPPPVCVTTSTEQPAGLVTIQHSPQLTTAMAALPTIVGPGIPAGTKVLCPPSHPNCAKVGIPLLANNVFWQNRVFHIGVGSAVNSTYQQHIVTLYNGNTTGAAASQTATGQCPAGSVVWDMGVRGDTAPGNHGSGFTLAPTYSVMTNGSEFSGGNNRTTAPAFVAQYCNGSRVPPESICHSTTGAVIPCGWVVPPGIADATVPNPIFNLTPNATVDEGNNWVNIQWGPLTMSNPVTATPTASTALANYTPGASVANQVPSGSNNYNIAPLYDFYNHPRKDNAGLDIGAIEVVADTTGTLAPTINTVVPNNAVRGSNVDITITGVNLTYTTAVVFPGQPNITVSGVTAVNSTTVTATLTLAPNTALGTGHVFHVTTTNPDGIARNSNNLNFTVQGATVSFTGPTPTLLNGATTAHSGTVTVHNATGANAGPFTFTAAPTIALVPNDNGTGTGTGAFTITGGTCAAGTVVAPGGACTITVQYTPPVTPVAPAGLRSRATLTITGTGLSSANGTATTSFNAN